MRDDCREMLWRFVRGDAEVSEFEPWAYAERDLESALGEEFYLRLVSTHFADRDEVWHLREDLARELRALPSPACLCIRLCDTDVVDMGYFRAPAPAFEHDREYSHEHVLATVEEFAKRGDEQWWLWAGHCRACGQDWLVGQEERHNDVFCLRRLRPSEARAIANGEGWPTVFDTYERLLEIAREVRFGTR